MRNHLSWTIWLAIILALGIAAVSRADELWNKLTEHDVASLTTSGIWAAVVGGAVIVMFRKRLLTALTAVLL